MMINLSMAVARIFGGGGASDTRRCICDQNIQFFFNLEYNVHKEIISRLSFIFQHKSYNLSLFLKFKGSGQTPMPPPPSPECGHGFELFIPESSLNKPMINMYVFILHHLSFDDFYD